MLNSRSFWKLIQAKMTAAAVSSPNTVAANRTCKSLVMGRDGFCCCRGPSADCDCNVGCANGVAADESESALAPRDPTGAETPRREAREPPVLKIVCQPVGDLRRIKSFVAHL